MNATAYVFNFHVVNLILRGCCFFYEGFVYYSDYDCVEFKCQ